MSVGLKSQVYYISLIHLIFIVLNIALLLFISFKVKRDYPMKFFYLMQFSIIGWMFFKIVKTVSYSIGLRWFSIVAYYFFICCFEPLFIEFCYSFYTKKALNAKVRRVVIIISSIQFLVVATNPWHYLFYSKFTFYGDKFGKLFYIWILAEYVIVGIGFMYMIKSVKAKLSEKSVLQKITFSIIILSPILVNLLFLSKVAHWFVTEKLGLGFTFDYTPIALMVCTYLLLLVIIRENIFLVSPIMMHEIIDKLDAGICVIDEDFEAFYLNEKIYKLFGENALEIINHNLSIGLREIIGEEACRVRISDKTFISKIIKVNSLSRCMYIMTLNNISDYSNNEKMLLAERERLDKVNKDLIELIENLKEESKIGARNYVGIELHDIIGHSLVVVIKLLEVAKLYLKRDRQVAEGAIKDCIESIDYGISSMENIYNRSGKQKGYDLKKSLDKKLKKLNDTNVETFLNFNGEKCSLDANIYDILNGACTEFITNSLKHSNCKTIFLTIDLLDEEIKVVFMDDGSGRDNLILGNGLSGIKKRVESVGGGVEFISSKNDGFIAKINI